MPNDITDPKATAYYSALLTAWVQSRMERDRTLITLSSGGVGLLLTLSSTLGVDNLYAFLLYCLGFCSFAVTIISCLTIFHRNSRHLEKVITGPRTPDPSLDRLDRLTETSFLLGVGSVVGIGVLNAALRYLVGVAR